MLIIILTVLYAVLIFRQQCCGLNFIELPGFQSDENVDDRLLRNNKRTKQERRVYYPREPSGTDEDKNEQILERTSFFDTQTEPQPQFSRVRTRTPADDRNSLFDTPTDPQLQFPRVRTRTPADGRISLLDTQTEPQPLFPRVRTRTPADGRISLLDTQTERQPQFPRVRTRTTADGRTSLFDTQTEPQPQFPRVRTRTPADGRISLFDTQTERQPQFPRVRTRTTADGRTSLFDTQTELQPQFPRVRARTPDGRRSWMFSTPNTLYDDIPAANSDDKDASLKSKIYTLVQQTLNDIETRMDGINPIKEKNRDQGPYKIGFILSLVKKSRDVLNELFNVAVKHRDEWKALEQLQIFELIVHTNVDTTNLVRQLVEIHIQQLNSTSNDEKTTEKGEAGSEQGERRVVLL